MYAITTTSRFISPDYARPRSLWQLVATANLCFMDRADAITDEVLRLLKDRGFRMTTQRRAIVTEVARSPSHIDPTSLIERIQAQFPDVNPSTVYRTLLLLDELGVLQHSHFEDGVQYHRASLADHAHLTCKLCGREQSLDRAEIEPLQELIEQRFGFAADLTHFAISGVCRACLEAAGRPAQAV
jgi:Fur family ferric uptake transcriptional regulator